LGAISEHRGSPQSRQGLVRLIEPRGKSRAEPRHGGVKNYEKMSEIDEAKQMRCSEIIGCGGGTLATAFSKLFSMLTSRIVTV
jgi:hypothetical protein